MEELFDIKGKVIAITGGGGVLCGTMAKALGDAGAKIAVLDLIETAAEKIAAFEAVGVRVARHPGEIAEMVAQFV